MTDIVVRRQFFRNQIRRTQIDNYIGQCRQKLIESAKCAGKDLTDQQLEDLTNVLDNNNYSNESLLDFIKTIQSRSVQSLNKPLLFVRLKNILMYIEEQKDSKLANSMVKEICQRVVSQAILHPPFLQKMFKEFFSLIGIQDFQLQSIWPRAALIRNQIYFRLSFQWFLEYLHFYVGDISDILSQSIETFLNFTIEFQKESLQLKCEHYLSITDSLTKILSNYQDINNQDLERSARCYLNIVHMNPIQIGLQMIQIQRVVSFFLKRLEKSQNSSSFQDENLLKTFFQLIGAAFSGTQKMSEKILQKNPKILELFCSLLPINNPFKSVPIPRPVNWTHKNIPTILGVMLSLCNLATLPNLGFELATNGSLSKIIELSAFPSTRVQQQVSIFLWNLLAIKQDQITQLVLERDALYAFCNILSAEKATFTSYKYGLQSLLKIVAMARTFPSNSPYWHFTVARIKEALTQSNTLSAIQYLCISSNKQISELAEKFLDSLQ